MLTGRRVLLREPTDEDAAAIFRHTSDPEVVRFLAFDAPATVEDTRGFIRKCREWREADREYTFVIAGVADDEPVGVTGLRHLDPQLRTAQIGTWLARAQWGTGINAEAKGLLLAFAFERLGLHRVEARIATANLRSLRAFERLGARRGGLLTESFFKGGSYQDQYLYVLFEQDWRRRDRRAAAGAGARR